MAMRNVGTFLWRTVYIQAVCRHYVYTLLELVVLLAVFYFSVSSPDTPPPLIEEMGDILNSTDMEPYRPDAIVYVAAKGNATKKGEKKKEEEDESELPLVVKEVESPDMVRSSCEGVRNFNASLTDVLCVELYDGGSEEGASNASLRFTVYMPTSVMGTETKLFPLGSLSESTKLAAAAGGTPEDPEAQPLGLSKHRLMGMNARRRRLTITVGPSEQQGVMGLTHAQFMLGHFLNIMVYDVIESIMFVLLMYPATSYAQGIDITLMLFSFFVYIIDHAIFILMLGWMFPKGWFGLIAGVVAIFYGPGFAGMLGDTSVQEYILAPRKEKLLSGLLPHTGFYSVLRILFLARDYEGGVKPLFDVVPVEASEKWAIVLVDGNSNGRLDQVLSVAAQVAALVLHGAGVSGATSGTARIFGYDATTQRDKIRTLVSYCQQTDIFFENLTCCENLLYFGSLKGTSWEALQATIAETLKLVHLEDKAYSMPNTLSGGMKRRLSLAFAIVSKPKLVILDEPTTGLDAETRRNVWDVIQALSKEHSVLLSSHDMEEADAIGDSIIVMARGKAVCSGSTSFLKKACGVGYKVSLVKEPGRFEVKDVLALIHKTVPGAEVDNDKTGEVIIALNTLNHEHFPAMFKKLEQKSEELGIQAIGVNAASMKEVYLNWSFLFVGILIPLLLQLYIATSIKMPSANRWSGGHIVNNTFPIEVRLGSHFPDSEVYLQDSTTTNASQGFRVLVESEGCRVHVVKDLHKALEEIALDDFGHYMRTYPVAAAFENNVTRGLANPTSMMAVPITFNMLHTAQLRQLTGKPAVRISATLTYLKLEYRLIQTIETFISGFHNMVYWAIEPALSYSLAFSAFAMFPVAERLGRAREVQLMTGVSGWLFVLAHLVFDYLCYMLIMVPWCLIHYSFNEYSQTMAGAMVVAVSVYGPTVIMFCYLMAERALTPGGAMASVILWFFGGGFILHLFSQIARLFVRLDEVLFIVPPYGLLMCFYRITDWQIKADSCYDETGIGSVLLVAAVEGVVLYVVLSVLLCGYCENKPDVIPGSQELEVDDDVEEEMKLVNQLRSNKKFGDYALVAWKLQKRFGDLHAVRGLYLALRRSECFGLLGVNGAGKTTTFEILAGLSNVTFGEAYTESATLSGRKTEWQPQISYCFQSGGLLDKLTGYEFLYLIGRLRGIPESELKGKVDSVLSIADLTPHAGKQSGVYSGGNQRKLAISAALLGLPPIVFLDEPYAGVDVVSRTKIFDAIGRVKKGTRTAFVLSSHNIDECEISCDRLTIMVQGQMMCLGTVQHLREKYGKGYRLHAMLKHGAASDAAAEAKRFVEAVPKQFPGIKLTDQHENVFSYHLVERIPWSELFTKVEALEKDFALEYAIVGDNTVEQIFIAFAKAGAGQGQIK
ncbi:phospholipid-transporting ATPase ABCA3-like [Haemaphysalis longicornis]